MSAPRFPPLPARVPINPCSSSAAIEDGLPSRFSDERLSQQNGNGHDQGDGVGGRQKEEKPPCPANGPDCPGCEVCDDMWLPPSAVKSCDMGGDPFVLKKLGPPQSLVDSMPMLFKGVHLKVREYI